MALVLAPSYDDHTREQVEAFIAAVRARRMVAAMEHYQGVHTKLTGESQKIQDRMKRELEKLQKRIAKCEEAEGKVEESIQMLEMLRQELGLTVDMIELHTPATEKEDV